MPDVLGNVLLENVAGDIILGGGPILGAGPRFMGGGPAFVKEGPIFVVGGPTLGGGPILIGVRGLTLDDRVLTFGVEAARGGRNGTDPGGTRVEEVGVLEIVGMGAPIGVGGGLNMAVGVLSTKGTAAAAASVILFSFKANCSSLAISRIA